MTTLALADTQAIAAWHLGAITTVTVPATGVVHRTLLLDSAAGPYVLRAYRHTTRMPVAREHALIAYAAARAIPAVRPVPLPDGDTILERDAHFYALFPFAPGSQISRSRLAPADLAAMGRFLAHLHIALADYPASHVKPRAWTADPAVTLAAIDRLASFILALPTITETDAVALERLESRRRWIEQSPGAPAVPLTMLPFQVTHGDYQDTNLFFANADVSAIIDWDQAYPAPRAWEAVRVLDLVCRLDPARSRAFLAAYRAVQSLPAADLNLAAAWYSHLRAHDLWLYHAHYLEANQRVTGFIHPGPFVPFLTRWQTLVPLL